MSSLVVVSASSHRSVGSLWATESSRGQVTRICSAAEPLRGLDGRKLLRPVRDELGVTLCVGVAAQCPTDPAENPSVAGFDGVQCRCIRRTQTPDGEMTPKKKIAPASKVL